MDNHTTLILVELIRMEIANKTWPRFIPKCKEIHARLLEEIKRKEEKAAKEKERQTKDDQKT